MVSAAVWEVAPPDGGAIQDATALHEKFLWQGVGTKSAQAADEVEENMAYVP